MFDTNFLNTQREKLLVEKKRVEADLGLVSEGGEARYTDLGDDQESNAQEVADFEKNLSAATQLRQLQADIDAALARLGEGTYGMCTSCGAEIPRERLEAVPFANTCSSCG